jgi:hypothetical protein
MVEHLLLPSQKKIQYPYGMPPDGADAVWRCEGKSYSYVVDADREIYGSTPVVLEMRWSWVKRRTKHGVYLHGESITFPKAKRSKWRNTPEEALASFIARRERQIAILRKQLKNAELELRMARLIP